jgi:putative ABC transport system substrate-binding protein
MNRDLFRGLALVITSATLILCLGGAEAAEADGGPMYRVGVLLPSAPATSAKYVQAFRDELQRRGYVEARNLQITYRYAEGKVERLAPLATELAQLKVNVIFAATEPALLAAIKAAGGAPVVTVTCDPMEKMAVALSKGNATGFSCVSSELAGKRLGLLKSVTPNLRSVALLYSAQDAYEPDLKNVETAAQRLGLVITRVAVLQEDDFDRAFALIEKDRTQAVYIALSGFMNFHRKLIAQRALSLRLPSIFGFREFPEEGGLLSYGASASDGYRRAAYFVDRILKGAQPRDLPPEEPTRFELVVNGRTASVLKLTIPNDMLLSADEVIR